MSHTRTSKNKTYKIILWTIGIFVLVLGIILFFIPPAVFPDPANGFQVLRSMQHGGGFNNFVAPDQGDISQNYSEFLTWWSPGQYLVPYFFMLVTGLNIGHAIAITIFFFTLIGLAGFYNFFKKIGFSPLTSAISLAFIICQLAFFIPFAYYNGGETLLFGFMGWFLYGCVSFEKPGIKMALFVLFAGWLGFFFKSSFIWIYVAGLCCLWIQTGTNKQSVLQWIKKGLWVGVPAVIALATIYLFFLSQGQSPATASTGFSLTAQAFTYPLASPMLGGFSIDDLGHWLIYYAGKPLLPPVWNPLVLLIFALLSLLLVINIIRLVSNNAYRLFLVVFYAAAILFFTLSYLKQLNISYETRHFRIISILIVPGIIFLVQKSKTVYKIFFAMICLVLAGFSGEYLVKGFYLNSMVNAKGITGIAQPDIDQQSLNKVIQLDSENRNIIFVFVNNDLESEVVHNRVITLQPIDDDLKINQDDYTYNGFGGALYIILPESYNGPKEKIIEKSFPGYAGFKESMLSDKYILCVAKMRR